MDSRITCKFSWSVIAYGGNGGNMSWHVMAWKDVISCVDGGWKWNETCNFSQKQENKQEISIFKFEFGVWEKTKSMKMRVFIIFKRKNALFMAWLWTSVQVQAKICIKIAR